MKKILKHQLLITLLVLNSVIFILFSPNHYIFELFLSMAFQITIGIGVLAILFILYKKWIGTSIYLIAILLIYTNIPYFHFSNTEKVKIDNIDLKVAHFNVLKFNTDYNKTIDAIIESQADLVSINEMTHQWKNALDTALKNKYPFRYLVAQNNSFGIGVFSKKELSNCETIWFEGLPYIVGEILVEERKTIQFLTAHTIPPTNKYAFAKRNKEIKHIEKHLKKSELPKLIIGDFNAVSWSPIMEKMRTGLNLSDSRKSYKPSYPAWNKLLMIPIDHIFYTKEISCLSFNTIKTTNSDHYGIIGFYRL